MKTTVKNVVDFVTEESKKNIREKTRKRRIPLLKQYCFLLCYKYVSDATFEEIGEELNVSHSNVYLQLNTLLDVFTVDKKGEKEFNLLEDKFLTKFPQEVSTRDFYITHNNYTKLKLCKELDKLKKELKESKKELKSIKHNVNTLFEKHCA